MARLDDSVLGGIGLFSFRTESYERLTMDGSDPIWLRDGRRLLYRENNTITTIDTKSKEIRRLLSAPPHSEFGVVCLSFDEHELFVTQSINEGDIWIFKANG
jgi:secreted PhoX family phosphatase